MKTIQRLGARGTATLIIFGIGLFWTSSALEATRPKTDNKNRQAVPGVVTPFGEVVRGPRGKSEIAITFDAGANAECFDDLIAALEASLAKARPQGTKARRRKSA